MRAKARVSAKTSAVKKVNSSFLTKSTTPSHSINSPAERLVFLQRTIGNQAVQRIIQSHTGISENHNKMHNKFLNRPNLGHDFSKIRVYPAEPRKVQNKLKISLPSDKYEQEADGVADQVVRISTSELPTLSQITTVESKQGDNQRRIHQTKEALAHTPEVTPELSAKINALSIGGQSLSNSVRAFFEPRFGADFSQVRVHTDARAAETSRMVNARAFTIGRNIVFGAGEYSPNSKVGQTLLAHELTHVIQQRDGNEAIQRGGIHIKLTPLEEFMWAIDIARANIERLKKLNPEQKLSELDRILGSLRNISSNPLFANLDPKVQREIMAHITTIEKTLSNFARAQKNNVKTVEESNFSWAAVGGVAVLDGPEPGPADAAALLFALGMALFGGTTTTTTLRDPELIRKQSEAIEQMVKGVSEALAKAKPPRITQAADLLGQAGALLTGTLLMSRLKDLADAAELVAQTIEEAIKNNPGPSSKCAEQIRKFRQAKDKFKDALANPKEFGEIGVIRSLEIFREAANSVLACLGMSPLF